MGLTKVNHPDLLDLASDTGATVFPKGTTAERPVSPEAGYIRFNTTDNVMETYDGTEWLVLDTLPNEYIADFLVAAGGGGGGARRGSGGGAGGLRTSYGATSGGGSSSEDAVLLNIGTEYTITIGAGGAAAIPGSDTLGGKGGDSVFSNITSYGGGGGISLSSPQNIIQDGGCGAGGGARGASDLYEYPPYHYGDGTLGQGYNGGYGSKAHNGGGGGGGGGGGAAGVGQNGVGNVNNYYGGGSFSGGSGLAVSITGSSLSYSSGGTAPNGTSGGGSAGTNNTGNGGDSTGEAGGSNGGWSGGSGIVILRMPTANYSGTTTGSPTVTTDGSDTILTYTSSGTYTA
jgi:hypothetical protein